MRAERVCEKGFGGGSPAVSLRYWPENESDVLEVLRRHAGERIRVAGSRHSWSEVIDGADVTLSMAAFEDVLLLPGGNVRVGGGCTIGALLERLHAQSELTLPTLGVITKQTIAGAISTGTHGTGKEGLSHYVAAIRVACYDDRGRPAIREHRDGDALLAARCAVGCMGVILEVELETVPKHLMVEQPIVAANLDGLWQQWPLSHVAYFPYGWDFVLFRRRVHEGPTRSALVTGFHRLWQRVAVDSAFHWGLRFFMWLGHKATKSYLRHAPNSVAKWRRVDDSHRILTFRHDLFPHEEMEVFVPESRLEDALAVLRWATAAFAGEPRGPAPFGQPLRDSELLAEIVPLEGSYTHHYPFSLRRIMPEETLISMAAGTPEPMISISLLNYHEATERKPFRAYCAWVARAFRLLFDARLHWGKRFPLAAADVQTLYPRMADFRNQCRAADPHGTFTNAFTERVIGLGKPGAAVAPAAAGAASQP